jgi:predicted nucleotidyltransferase
MSYNISSDQLSNPLLKELLQVLTDFFRSEGSEFYVIGATARDIVMAGIHTHYSGRKTVDLDIAIAIPDWNKYEELTVNLCKKQGFIKSPDQKQRFLYKNFYLIDIVPFGNIAKTDKYIYWPPEESVAMPVHGFVAMAKNALEITLDNSLIIRVASLLGIFILKLIAWQDRNLVHEKDAEDIAFILANYLSLNEERAVIDHYDIYDRTPFSTFVAGATLMARDLKAAIQDETSLLDKLTGILQVEISKTLESHLINQMIETHPIISYEEVYDSILVIIKELLK